MLHSFVIAMPTLVYPAYTVPVLDSVLRRNDVAGMLNSSVVELINATAASVVLSVVHIPQTLSRHTIILWQAIVMEDQP